MTDFHAIAAMSENRVIGNQGKIPWHIPEDFRWFKHKTMGGTLIMGARTMRSVGKVLPGRFTIVLTRHTTSPGVETCMDLKSLNRSLERAPKPYWVCGGAEIYALLLPRCDRLYLTRVKRSVDGDVLLPEFENDFAFAQTIHDTPAFCVELWARKGSGAIPLETWPFAS